MLTQILIGVAVLIGLLVLYIATRPGEFTVTRSATMSAPPAVVHGLVNDFHEWTHWSPWEHRDPNLNRRFEGPPSGKGSTYHWVGNKNVGEGEMRILDSKPGELVLIHLEFIKPFKSVNTTEFAFKPDAGGTRVVWTMKGKNGFMSKAMTVFMSMDKMVGGDFEKGLADMKTAAEKSARA